MRRNRNKYLATWRERSKPQIALACRRWLLKTKYGLSLEDYDSLILTQANKCLICSKEFTQYKDDRHGIACVDHCHKTGIVRGLLCHRCNTAIGFMEEDSDRFWNAISYLAKSRYTSL